MNTQNIIKAIKNMSVNEIRDFTFENYYKRIKFSQKISYCSVKRLKRKHLLLLANKLIKRISNHRNGKEQYESFLRKKSRKSIKELGIITSQPKTFENPNIVDIESIITEH